MPPPGEPAMGPAGKTITPGDVMAILKQRLVTIIVLSILFGGMAIGVFVLLFTKYPEYSAKALIECRSNAPRQQFEFADRELAPDAYTRFVQTQAMVIKSFSVLSSALQSLDVQATAWYQATPKEERLKELEDALRCTPLRDTNLIEVGMAAGNPNDPHRIVNTVVEVYLQTTREQASALYRQELNEYRRERNDVKEQIQKKQEQIRDFRGKLPPGEASTTGGQLGQGVILQQLVEDMRIVAEYEQQAAELEGLLQVYSDPTGVAVSPDDRMAVEQDPRVAQLDAQVTALEQEMNILLKRFGPNHREYKEMAVRRDEVQEQLESARSNRLREVLDFKKQQIETAYYNAQNALMLARERLDERRAQQADIERQMLEYNTFLDELELLEEYQMRLDEYIREIERIVRERSAISVYSRVPAVAPRERSFPSLLLLPAMLIFAFAAAVGLAVGIELLDNSVKTPQDVTRHLEAAVLGAIPDVDDEEVEIERVESAVRDMPHSMVAEAFRTVRSNLQFSAPADRMRSLLVTSPKPEDGRTAIAANLAASLANGGRRVLLIDANLRRPALHNLYPSARGAGLTNVLIGEAQLSDCIRRTDLPNLDIVGSGPVPPNPAELLSSDLCRKLVAEAVGQYDHVVFDSPPVLLASDASVLATLVDGTILVVRARENSRGVAQRAISLLGHVNAHLFGVVLNVARVQRGGYFREQLRTFYDYQPDETTAAVGRTLPGGDGPGDKDSDEPKSA